MVGFQSTALAGGDGVLDRLGHLFVNEFERKTSRGLRTTRDWTLPSITSDFSGGRFSAAIAAPERDMSMMRQVILVPSSSVSNGKRIARNDNDRDDDPRAG